MLIPLVTQYANWLCGFEYGMFSHIHEIVEQLMFPYVTKLRDHCRRFNVSDNELIKKWFEQVITMYLKVSLVNQEGYHYLDIADSFQLTYVESQGIIFEFS